MQWSRTPTRRPSSLQLREAHRQESRESLAHIVCLIVVRDEGHALLLLLYRDILQVLNDPAVRRELLEMRRYAEFLALLASQGPPPRGGEARPPPAA